MNPPGPRMTAVIEDAEWLADTGETAEGAAARLGYKDADSLERALERAGHYRLFARLKANGRWAA
jgi:hypothetical protein